MFPIVVLGRAWACLGMLGRAWACLGVLGCAWACLGVLGQAWVVLHGMYLPLLVTFEATFCSNYM